MSGPSPKRPKSTGAVTSGKANLEGAPRASTLDDASQEQGGRDRENRDGARGKRAQKRTVGEICETVARNAAAGVEGAEPEYKRKKVVVNLSESLESEHRSRAAGAQGVSDAAGDPQPEKSLDEKRGQEERSESAGGLQRGRGILKQEGGVEKRGVVQVGRPKVNQDGGHGLGGSVSRGRKCSESADSCIRTKETDKADSAGEEDACDECGEGENPELIVRCARARCGTVAHIYCVSEEMDEVPEGEWLCDGCEEENEADKTAGPTERASLRRGGEAESIGMSSDSRTNVPNEGGGGRMGDLQRNRERLVQGKVPGGGSGMQGSKRKPYVIGGLPICQHAGCERRAWYSLPGSEAYPRVCSSHKSRGMVVKCASICEVLDCQHVANYSFPGQTRRRRCGAHKEDGMFMLSSLCEVPGCLKPAGYGSSEGRKCTRCSRHKDEGTKIPLQRCKQPGCLVMPHYGYAGRSRSFCKRHSAEGMVHDPLVRSDLKWRR